MSIRMDGSLRLLDGAINATMGSAKDMGHGAGMDLAQPKLRTRVLRLDLDKERQGHVAAKQRAAVLAEKLEAAKVKAAKNTIVHLSGKLEALQVQIKRPGHVPDADRHGNKKAGGEAADPRGKPVTKPSKEPPKV